MADESAQVKSPLIGQPDEDHSSRDIDTPEVVVDGVDGESIELQSRRSGLGSGFRATWTLKYHDIVPGKFAATSAKSFSDLVQIANDWLEKNPDKRIRDCEAITWFEKNENKLIDSEYMISSRRWAEDSVLYNVRGLRLWLVPAKQDETQTKLHHIFITPDTLDDTKNDLLDKLNAKLQKGEITGEIIQVETIPAPLVDGRVDPESLYWSDHSNEEYRKAWCFNVFYLDGGHPPPSLILKDFVPKQTNEGYDGFESLVERCNDWLKDQDGGDLFVMQSFMVMRHETSTEPGYKCYWTWPSVKEAELFDVFRMLRVFVSTGSTANTESNKGIAFENFTPKLITTRQEGGSNRERAERMSETVHRLTIYLEASNVKLLGVETVMNPVQIVDKPDSVKPDLDIKLLFSLRAYMTSESVLNYHKSQQLTRTGSQRRQGSFRHSTQRKTKKKQNNDSEHPGPIFLGNVVNRRYKYRWIVVGVTAFVAMSLIVILSVIYSNI